MAEHKQIPPTIFIDIEETISENDIDQEDNSKVAQWLAPVAFAANDGLVSTASLMLGMGAVSQDVNAMIVTGFLGLVAGSCSMSIAEFISVDSTLENEDNQRDNENIRKRDPIRAAIAVAFAFSVGALVPLTVALLLEGYNVTLGVVEGPISVVLAVFGWIGAFLDGAPGFRAALRVLLWGWVAMVVTFGLLINRNW